MSFSLKKILVFGAVGAALTAGSQTVFASAKNSTLTSVQWIMSAGARLAEVDDADTPLMNSAGTANMKDGLHIHLTGHQVQGKTTFTSKESGKKYTRSSDSVLPVGATTYKKDSWALFFTLQYPGSSGGGTFDGNGVGIMDTQFAQYGMTAQNRSYESAAGVAAFTAGGAYKFNKTLSAAFGVRRGTYFSNVKGKADLYMDMGMGPMKVGEFKIDQYRTGKATGYVLGLNWQYSDDLLIAFRHESELSFDLTVEVGAGDSTGVVDGSKETEVLPALYGVGIGYRISPEIKLDAAINYFLEDGAEMTPGKEYTDKYGNSFDAAVAVTYDLSSKATVRGGYRYTPGVPENARTFTYQNDKTTYNYLGFGIDYHPTEDFKILGAYGQLFYDKGETPNDPNGNYEIDTTTRFVSLGFEYVL